MSWPVKKFSELVNEYGIFIDGDWVESKDQDPNGEVRLIQLADIGVGRFVNKSSRFMTMQSAQELKCTFLREGDILIARMPDPVGRACIFPKIEQPCVTVVDICIMRPDSREINSRWLMHLINSNGFSNQVNQFITGTTRQRISRGNLAKLEVIVPPLSEQKRIASILDKADAIRRKRQQAIKIADDFLRSVFLEMFGDPVTNPKGWEVEPLIELCSEKMQNGAYFPKECYADNGIEMVHMSDAFYDTVQRGRLKRVICSHEDVDRYNLNENQLLISRRSLTYEGAAKPSLVPKSTEPLIFESSLIRVCPSQDKMLARFLFQYLSTESVKEQHVRKYVTGATIKGISQKNLEKISVYVPPIALQKKFVEKVIPTANFGQLTNIHFLPQSVQG